MNLDNLSRPAPRQNFLFEYKVGTSYVLVKPPRLGARCLPQFPGLGFPPNKAVFFPGDHPGAPHIVFPSPSQKGLLVRCSPKEGRRFFSPNAFKKVLLVFELSFRLKKMLFSCVLVRAPIRLQSDPGVDWWTPKIYLPGAPSRPREFSDQRFFPAPQGIFLLKGCFVHSFSPQPTRKALLQIRRVPLLPLPRSTPFL